MKISGRKDSPDNPRVHFRTAPIVLLDGHVVERVIEADEEAGVVIVEEQDENGRAFLRDNRIAERTLRGKVQLVVSAVHALRRQPLTPRSATSPAAH